MKFKEECVFLGVSSFHSKKNDKDYNKLDLHLPDNDIVTFFVTDEVKKEFYLNPYSKVLVEFDVKFNRGNIRVNVLGATEC